MKLARFITLGCCLFLLIFIQGCSQSTSTSEYSSAFDSGTVPGTYGGTLLTVDSSYHLTENVSYNFSVTLGTEAWVFNTDGTFQYLFYPTDTPTVYSSGLKGTYTYNPTTMSVTFNYTSSYNKETSTSWVTDGDSTTWNGYFADSGFGDVWMKNGSSWTDSITYTYSAAHLTANTDYYNYSETNTIVAGIGSGAYSETTTRTDTTGNYVAYTQLISGDSTVLPSVSAIASGDELTYTISNATEKTEYFDSSAALVSSYSGSKSSYTVTYADEDGSYLVKVSTPTRSMKSVHSIFALSNLQ